MIAEYDQVAGADAGSVADDPTRGSAALGDAGSRPALDGAVLHDPAAEASTVGNTSANPVLLQQSNMTYLGAFALPSGTYGTSTFAYGGLGLGFHRDPDTGAATLFMEGNFQNPGQVAQVQVPENLSPSNVYSALSVATVLQPFADISEGAIGTFGDSAAHVHGILSWEGRLILGVSEYVDGNSTQQDSHGVSGLDLARSGDFAGWFSMEGVGNARSKGGFMTPIPLPWRAALGGPALTGNCCIPYVAATSAGPSVTVFDPADVGSASSISGTTLLYYPESSPLAGLTTTNEIFNRATRMGGVAFPTGSGSVLFFGVQGTGAYCNGTGAECGDPVRPEQGEHAYPYRHQVWAYDAKDLVQVKEGALQPWELKPYATWSVGEIDASGAATIRGVALDPDTNRLYVTTDDKTEPRVHVFAFAGM